MIKYLDLEGYVNKGELGIFTHLYQFIQKEFPHIIILIRAYNNSNLIWNGIILNDSKTYENIEINNDIKNKIEEYTGKLRYINDLNEFAKNTIFEEQLKVYKVRLI